MSFFNSKTINTKTSARCCRPELVSGAVDPETSSGRQTYALKSPFQEGYSLEGRGTTDGHRGNRLSLKTTFMFLLAALIMSASTAFAYDKVVVLYAAVSPILKELGVGDKVVGVSKTDNTFAKAIKLGSHLKPNIELLNALEPDLIITGSKRTFKKDMLKLVKAPVIHYDPRNLDDIMDKITEFGKLFEKEAKAAEIVSGLKEKLANVKPLPNKPSLVYEISARPLRVAGAKSILTAIVEAAGGRNIVKVDKKHVLLSPEVVLKESPDYYLYQTGPMNRNPAPPKEREAFSTLKSKVIHVDEYEFARPGLNSFEAVLKLNRMFLDR